MDNSTAERWVVVSALTVGGIYAYRRLTEPAQPGGLKNIVGVGPPVPLGQFATAWGFTFLVVGIMATASPGLGGSFAILIMTADLLTNTANLTADVAKQQGTTTVNPNDPTATVTASGVSLPGFSPLVPGSSTGLPATPRQAPPAFTPTHPVGRYAAHG